MPPTHSDTGIQTLIFITETNYKPMNICIIEKLHGQNLREKPFLLPNFGLERSRLLT